MLSELRFPVLAPHAIEFQAIHNGTPAPGSWIICTCKHPKHHGFALYKWQEKNNPEITSWSYINIHATVGLSALIKDPQFSDDRLILVRDEKYKDYKIG